MMVLLLLLLPSVACVVRPLAKSGADSTEWVTVKVDSPNVGRTHGSSFDGEGHEYTYSPTRFRSKAQLSTALLGPEEHWTDDEREAICRICLRHEWQALKIVPKPVPKTEFESLEELLRVQVDTLSAAP